MTERPIKFWTASDDAERVSARTQAEAIREWIEQHHPDTPLPETMTLYGLSPLVPPADDLAEGALDGLLEALNDEYGEPDGGYTASTDAMRAAARAFVRSVLAEYEVWMCDIVETVTVNPAEVLAEAGA